MKITAELERDLRQTLRQARLVAGACTILAPIIYAGTVGSQTLGGRWQAFFAGFDRVSWEDPRLPRLLAAGSLALALALVLPPRIGRIASPRGALMLLWLRSLV